MQSKLDNFLESTPIFIGLVGVIAIITIGFIVVIPDKTQKPAETKTEVSFDPKQTTCFFFDMNPGRRKDSWFPVTERNRYRVSEGVSLGKYEWKEMETTTCYKRYPDKSIGEPIVLRNEWYKRK